MAPSVHELLVAALFVGQAPASPGSPAQAAAQAQPSQSVAAQNTENRPILSRIRRLFGRGDAQQQPTPSAKTPAERPSTAPKTTTSQSLRAPGISSVEPPKIEISPNAPANSAPTAPANTSSFPRRMPTGLQTDPQTPKVAVVEEKSSKNVVGAPSDRSTPILAANANRIGREDDFKWITGQIEVEKGKLLLYYATPETVDPHNGVVILQTQDVDVKSFRSGDLVSVHGTLVRSLGAAATYRVTSIDLIDRPKTR